MKSLFTNSKKCWACGKEYDLERHHVIFGTANRKKAEEDGLWVYLCHQCHHDVHNKDIWEKKALQELGQQHWEETYGDRKAFIKRYGKSYL